MRISRVAQSCETSKEANRISQKYTANKEFWHENRGIPRMKPLLRRLLRVDGSLSRRNARPHNAQLEGFSVPTHSPWDTSAFVPESAIPRVLFRKQKQVSRLQSSHNNSWGWVSLLVAWNALTRSILLACDFVKASQCIAIVTKEEDVMCFRPPDTTSGPLICPECGKKIVSPNFRPVNCPFCKAPLPSEGAPAAPSAGGAPVAPGAPTVPGAPKPPSGK